MNILHSFQPPVREWFEASFAAPTGAQAKGWVPITQGRSTLLLAPTGSGKTLAAFLAAIDRLMFSPEPPKKERCRVLYVSPLKALAVDVERNLRAPLAGIAAVAQRSDVLFREPTIAIRTGDTSEQERAQIRRTPPDVLITTPESLYLILTSAAREILASVETVIIDEIHSLVSTKRGSHLFVSLERLEELRANKRGASLQRIGLSATQRPLQEIARLLGGGTLSTADGTWQPRDVEIVDAGSKKTFELCVEVPVEDMAKLGEVDAIPSGPAAGGGARRSIWPAMHPRLVELIRRHRSTMIFVNSRRLAERLAGALNECAGEEIALAHHGSIAREKRSEIEDRLKRGTLPAIVATSSLELGIDMGAVDLVIQIEAPPSVASGMQRIGRASHQVGAVSRGIIFPKFRGDLLACAAATARMEDGLVEETFYERNPLDVLAQQIVAIAGLEEIPVNELYCLVRRAAPFAELPRSSFEGVLDMLSGRYPSDEFAELKPRLTWDRIAGVVRARQGAQRVAVVNAGTIPDRGLYGVFLAGDDLKTSRRVGELDEEMVFESRAGDVFLLGASSWRIEQITHDRVLVSPAAGEPGKMPFWHGDRPGRPPEFGRAIGELSRVLLSEKPEAASKRLKEKHSLSPIAAANLMAYLREQQDATGEVPSDKTIIIERYVDEIGDWRVCILSPFGARIHAPWCMAIAARLQAADEDAEVDTMWTDDGMVFRMPESESAPDIAQFLPGPDEIEDLVVRHLGQTSLFASHFRENAARALLLPRRHPGRRSPLWAQRKRAADLLGVASRYGSFPILLETYRECLREVFDLPALTELLQQIKSRQLRVVTVDSRIPSPFASSLLFSYVANFIYDGDAPLAERRAQALSVDQAQLKELLGDAELRELLDAEAITQTEAQLQRLEGAYPLKHADALHDMLLSLGDLSCDEIVRRAGEGAAVDDWLQQLQHERRVAKVLIAGEERWIAAEDAGRMRDALGVPTPIGLPQAFLEPAPNALTDLVSRYARTHGPFVTQSVASRFGLGVAVVQSTLSQLAARDRVLEGEFTPGVRGREWCDPEVLRSIKRRSLAKLRREVEPVEPAAYGRFLVEWQEVGSKRSGLDALLSVIEQLQGVPIPASVLESEVLSARLENYHTADLDALCAAGEIVWRGLEPLGPSDGRIALYLTDRYRLLAPHASTHDESDELTGEVREILQSRGAQFFSDLQLETGAFPGDLVNALWNLVWSGEATNDTLAPLRSYLRGGSSDKPQFSRARRSARGQIFRSRRAGPPGSEGRWSLLPKIEGKRPTETERRAALATQLLERYGVLTREVVQSENIPGGFSAVYEVLKVMEENGKIRRGYFVAGRGATQFALPGADDRLRALRSEPDEPRNIILAATDPANPYGAALPWPEREGARPGRAAGAQVILHNGHLAAWIGRTEKTLLTFLPEAEPERGECAEAITRALAELVEEGRRRAVLISKVDGAAPQDSALAEYLSRAGFSLGSRGFLKRMTLTY
jgi:ATP-dependent Lhr-like helicase